MRLAQLGRMLAREARSSWARLAFFCACLALGVAAVVAVAGLSAALQDTIRVRARELLAADLSVSSRRALPEELDAQFAASGVEMTRVREMATLVAAPSGASLLVELKVVDGEYPFYGTLTLDPPGTLRERLGPGNCAVAPELLTRLRLARGDQLKIGAEQFTIDSVIAAEPDRLNFSLTLGPRVFLSAAAFERADLQKQGSSIRHVALGKSRSGAEARALAKSLRERPELGLYLNVRTWEDAQPSLRESIKRTQRFLALTALASLLVGGIGIAQTVRAWIESRLDAIAVQKCLGMTSREIFGLYAAQTALLAALGSALGAGLGVLAQMLVIAMLQDFAPGQNFELLQPMALARGIGLGLGVALLFSMRPLFATLGVPPARVLRHDAQPLRARAGSDALLAALLLAGLLLAAFAQSSSWLFAAGFSGSVLAIFGVLLAAAAGVVRICSGKWRERLPLTLRHAVAGLARPGAGTLNAIVALGLGVLVVLCIQLVQAQLARELDGELPRGAPTVFLVDVQTEQWPRVRELLQAKGASEVESAPVVVARLAAIDGVGVDELARRRGDDRGAKWTLTREQRLTYAEQLPDDNEIVAGELWSDPLLAEASLESEFADSLGAELGSTLSFDVQGVPIDLKVTSLRKVEWRSFSLNFFLLVEPGVLDEAPQFRVASARIEKRLEDPLQDELVAGFPNVTLLRIREILEKLAAVLARVGAGVRLLGLCTVISGAAILLGAISASASRRAREVALFKTLGLVRGEVARIYLVEHGLVGLVAGAIGALGANALAWGVVEYGMELDFRFDPLANAVALLATGLLAALAGLAASLRPLLVPPIQALRSE